MHKKIGLALGSGSARGLAHFGVIRALQEEGFEIGWVSGSSIGAVVGAAFAAGAHEQLEQSYRDMDRKKIWSLLDIMIPRSGIIEGEKVVRFVVEHIGVEKIEALTLPMSIVTTNLNTGKAEIFTSGSIAEAIRASIAVPGFMAPIKIGNELYVDGGIVIPTPVEPVRQLGADFVVAVDLNSHLATNGKRIGRRRETNRYEWLDKLQKRVTSIDHPMLAGLKHWIEGEPAPGLWEVLMSSVDIMQARISELSLTQSPPDILIQPALSHIRFLDFHKADEVIEIGYTTAKRAIADFRKHHDKQAPPL